MAALRTVAVCLLVPAAALCGGCVRRTMEVTSDPPGAGVVVNGHDAGTTPVRVEFRHHGTYRIELRKDGYEPVVAAAPVPRKFYELDGADLVAEVLWPGVIVDDRRIHYALKLSPSLTTAEKERLIAAGRRAAEDAEQLIPKLYEAPPPSEYAKDRELLRLERREKREGKQAPKDEKDRKGPKLEDRPDRPDTD